MLGISFLFWISSSAIANDVVYRFNPKTLKCEAPRGEPGFNVKGWRPCTDFRRRPLERLDRAKLNLKGSNFEGRTVTQLRFQQSNFSYTDFRNTQLDRTVFDRLNLTGADFRGAKISYVSLLGSETRGSLIDASTRIKGVEGNSKILNYYDDSPGKNFALSNDMIYFNPPSIDSPDGEIEGGVIRQIAWNDEKGSGYLILDIYARTLLFFIDKKEIVEKASTFDKLGKVGVGLELRQDSEDKIRNYVSYIDLLIPKDSD